MVVAPLAATLTLIDALTPDPPAAVIFVYCIAAKVATSNVRLVPPKLPIWASVTVNTLPTPCSWPALATTIADAAPVPSMVILNGKIMH